VGEKDFEGRDSSNPGAIQQSLKEKYNKYEYMN